MRYDVFAIRLRVGLDSVFFRCCHATLTAGMRSLGRWAHKRAEYYQLMAKVAKK